jgi:nitrate reductase assembly molybdenum cofactor insertion protein NarJ
MGDAVDRARAARNVLERLGRKVPGFAGYLDRELTREIDQLVRAHLANSLDAARTSVAAYTRTLHLGAAGRLERLGSLEKELDALANAVRHAGSGYAGLFDAVKVGQEQLQAVYHLEMAFVEDVEAVAEAAEHLSEGEGELNKLSETIAKVRVRLESRDQAFKGVFA